MRFVFSTSMNGALTIHAAVDLARRYHFDGLELNGLGLPPGDASAIQRIFLDASVQVAAVNFGVDVAALAEKVEFAASLKSRNIRIKSDRLLDRSGVLTRKSIEQLTQAGDIAADFGMIILIENQSTPGSAVRLWHILDRLNHPAIAGAWNATAAVHASDNPTVAIPTLNSRIRYVELNLDDCAIPSRKTIDRLRGIGFDGYVLVAAGNHAAADESELEQALIRAQATLQKWQILRTATA